MYGKYEYIILVFYLINILLSHEDNTKHKVLIIFL